MTMMVNPQNSSHSLGKTVGIIGLGRIGKARVEVLGMLSKFHGGILVNIGRGLNVDEPESLHCWMVSAEMAMVMKGLLNLVNTEGMLLVIESSDEEHKWMRPKSLESPPIHKVKLIIKGQSLLHYLQWHSTFALPPNVGRSPVDPNTIFLLLNPHITPKWTCHGQRANPCPPLLLKLKKMSPEILNEKTATRTRLGPLISRNCLFPMALSTQSASTSRTSAEWAPPHWKHDVFLSFRGEDTRSGFLSHLYHELQYWQAIKTFKDDRDLEIGATISPELLTAIKESHLAIIVLSPNYATSAWCLDELSKILECMQETKRILPIFYHVDPSDVRNQRRSFAEAFTKHEEKFRVVNWWRAPLRKVANLFGWDSKHEEFSGNVEMVNRWRAALTKIGNISGWDSKNYPSEAELIKHIVKCVRTKVHPTFRSSGSLDKLVGIDSALEQLHLQLAPEEKDVRFIGIWGMGGVGKTTLAKFVFQSISLHFEHTCFLSDVRKKKLSALQEQLLFPILKANHIWDEGEGTIFIKKYFCNKRVLLVLDDADQLNQLEKLVGQKNWFGVGSRIIITTRDERLLEQHDITKRYKFEVLKNDEALELFSRHAFKKDQPEEDFLELSKHFIDYAKGLPLALITLGSSLYTRGQDTWKSVLSNLGKIPNQTVFDSLKVSYDGLEEMEKRIFLHVAFFHIGKDKEQVIEILDSVCDISSRIMIDILIEKSLISIEKLRFHCNIVKMHDLIQEMAYEIFRQAYVEQPGKRSCLWHREEISHVIMNNTGTGAIEAIVLRLPKLEVVRWNCSEAFSEMHKLRLVEFDNVIFSSGPIVLPNSLRIFCWSWYPSKSLPLSFLPRFLVKLEMPHSKLFRLWDGAKDLPMLKHIDIRYSDELRSTPDFTGIQNLETLQLQCCTNLVEVHSSFAVLKKLKALNLSNCKSIESLPSKVELVSLEFFSVSDCPKVKRIPEFEGEMKNLSMLFVGGTAIKQLPSSIERLVGLVILGISDCKSLFGLPSAICNLKSLRTLYLRGCSKLDKLPGKMEHLEHLDSRETAIKLPLDAYPDPNPWRLVLSSLNDLCSSIPLERIDCNTGEGAIPDDIGGLSSLLWLHLSGKNSDSLPQSIEFLYELESFELERCERLQRSPDLPLSEFFYENANDCSSESDDVSLVLKNDTGTCAIEAIVLCLPKLGVVPWNCTKAFSEMPKFRLVEFDHVILSSGPKVLPNSLTIIHRSWYPSNSLMRSSKLSRLWDGARDFPTLKYIYLRNSDKLTSIPDFTRFPNLEGLTLNGCKKLREVHPSIAVHKKLKVLSFYQCKSIKGLPSELDMDSLESFRLWGCPKVKKIPEFGEHMQNLKMIALSETAIEQIPSSIERLVGLDCLFINDCKSLMGLPSAICKLKSLKTLYAIGCSKVDKLPGEMECLEELHLCGSAMREPLVAMKNLKSLSLSGSVASSLNRLGSLTKLCLSGCNIGEGVIPDDISCFFPLKEFRCLQLERFKRLEQLPDLPPKGSSLFVHVDDCTSLKRLSDPSKLSEGANVESMYRLSIVPILYALVELPLPPQTCSDWVGIALCVVFEDSNKQLEDPGYAFFRIDYFQGTDEIFRVGHLVSQHLWVFYLPRDDPRLKGCLKESSVFI
ncbi:unnamed protein product [Prunus armeniaca]